MESSRFRINLAISPCLTIAHLRQRHAARTYGETCSDRRGSAVRRCDYWQTYGICATSAHAAMSHFTWADVDQCVLPWRWHGRRPGRAGRRSAAAAPPQQIRRNRSRRLDEAFGLEPGAKQGVQDGGQLAVRRTHPDPDAIGIVVRRGPPALGLVTLSWRPAAPAPLAAGEARMHDRGGEPATRTQHRHSRQGTRQVIDVHQRQLAGTAIERPPVPPGGVSGDVGADVGDVLRPGGTGLAEHHGRDVGSGDVGPRTGQIAAHPALPARDVQRPAAGHDGQQAGVRRDQRRRVADPLLIPFGELVIPCLRLLHALTLTALPVKTATRPTAKPSKQPSSGGSARQGPGPHHPGHVSPGRRCSARAGRSAVPVRQ